MTDRHVFDDLPMLLTGDATRDVVMAAATHLRSCPDCQQELVSAVVAHASLTSAHRFAPEILASDQPLHPQHAGDAGPLPDMSGLFAQARQDAEVKAAEPGRRHRRRRGAVAAAAAVVVGGGVTYGVTQLGPDDSSTRSVSLEGDLGARDAKVQLIDGGRMRLDASSLPKLGTKQQYEVWLTSKDFDRKQSIGFIDDGTRTAEFAVPQKVMSQYNDIAVSVQGIHETQFSGKVVLHGRYG